TLGRAAGRVWPSRPRPPTPGREPSRTPGFGAPKRGRSVRLGTKSRIDSTRHSEVVSTDRSNGLTKIRAAYTAYTEKVAWVYHLRTKRVSAKVSVGSPRSRRCRI